MTKILKRRSHGIKDGKQVIPTENYKNKILINKEIKQINKLLEKVAEHNILKEIKGFKIIDTLEIKFYKILDLNHKFKNSNVYGESSRLEWS